MVLVRDMRVAASAAFQGREAHTVPLSCYLSHSESMVLGPLPQEEEQQSGNRSKHGK